MTKKSNGPGFMIFGVHTGPPKEKSPMTKDTAPATFEPDMMLLHRTYNKARSDIGTVEAVLHAVIDEYERQRAEASWVSVPVEVLKTLCSLGAYREDITAEQNVALDDAGRLMRRAG